MPAAIRDLRPDLDAASVAHVCEATPYKSPPDDCLPLLSAISALPYCFLEPELATVLDDGEGRVIGYALGTTDTDAFIRRYRSEYCTSISQRAELTRAVPSLDPHRFPAPGTPAFDAEGPDRRRMLGDLFRPERKKVDALVADGYTAHIHANIIASHRGGGAGERLVRTMLAKLARRGVTGVHAHLAADNHRAARFWTRLGFERRSEAQPWVFVRRIEPADLDYVAT